MIHDLTVFQPVLGDALAAQERFLADPGEWLPQPLRRSGSASWYLDVRFRSIRHEVRCDVGAAWLSGGTAWRHLGWEPEPLRGDPSPVDRLLPSLDGELGLSVHQGTATLVLSAGYDPPGAAIGDLADAFLLGRVARSTLAAFLGDVAANLGDRSVVAA